MRARLTPAVAAANDVLLSFRVAASVLAKFEAVA